MHEHMYEEIDKQTKAVLIIMDKNTKQQNTVKQEGFLAQLFLLNVVCVSVD